MKKINLVKKNFYFAIIVVVLLFVVGFVIAAYGPSKASHGTLYTDRIEPKSSTDNTIEVSNNLDVLGQLLVAGQPLSAGYWVKSGNDIYYDNGNVGIGITSPSQKLEVAGTVKADDFVKSDGTAIGEGKWSDGTSGAIYYDAGNVGVGTTSPSTELEVAGTIKAQNFVNDDGSPANKWFDGTSGAIYYDAGNVGIGVDSPAEKLDVDGNIKASGICIGDDCKTDWPSPLPSGPTSVHFSDREIETNGNPSVAEGYCQTTYGSSCHVAAYQDIGGNDRFYCWCW